MASSCQVGSRLLFQGASRQLTFSRAFHNPVSPKGTQGLLGTFRDVRWGTRAYALPAFSFPGEHQIEEAVV